jgi:hypothetical protein
MPSTSAYSLLPTSSGSTEILRSQDDFEDSWPSERPPSLGWFPIAELFATQRSKLAQRPHTATVVVAGVVTLCLLALLTGVYDYSLLFDTPVNRECFELPADELVWQTTQLPPERSPLCPFDPESFIVLQENPSYNPSKPGAIQWSNECLESMLADGQVHAGSCDQSPRQNIDLVWTWVNGSSPLLELTRQDRVANVSGLPLAKLKSKTIAGLSEKLFR